MCLEKDGEKVKRVRGSGRERRQGGGGDEREREG